MATTEENCSTDSARDAQVHLKGEMGLIMALAVAALGFMLPAALPACTAIKDGHAAMRAVSVECKSASCLSPRQLITAKEVERMKRELGDRALLVDIRGRAEAPAAILPIGSDANVPFMEPVPAPEMELRIDFAWNVDDVLGAKHLRHEDPVILVSPSGERSVLAALLLQEHGYSRVFVMRD